MKKIMLLGPLLLVAGMCFAQEIETMKEEKPKNYLKRSKTQKIFAWTLVGVGTNVLAATAIDAAVSTTYRGAVGLLGGSPEREKTSYGIPIAIGLASLAGSITLFSAAAKNKRIAMSGLASLKMEGATGVNSTTATGLYPVVVVNIRF